jgi:dual specificity phosphatase 12
LRPRLDFAKHLAVYPLEIDDAADTDILTHLPSCVAWIHEALEKRERSINPEAAAEPMPPRNNVIDKIAPDTKPGGVLVHCQAGMSRSATVVSAFLMQTLDLGPLEAVEMVREKRPVIE